MKRVFLLAGLAGLLTAMSVQASEQHAVPMSDYGTGTFYVKAGVRDVSESEFMVDTGSGYVVFSRDLIADLLEYDMARYLRSINLALANGEVTSAAVYHVKSMTIGQSCRIRNVDVVVLPNGGKCILGLSALSKAAPFTISTEPPTLTLSHCLAT